MSGDTPDRGGEGSRSVGSTGAGESGLTGTFEPGTLISFTYRVEALLARGGMGEVYRTTHTEIGTQHAIKIVRPDLANNDKIMELFRREASVLRTVREDAIVGYDGVLRDEEGRVYLVMEFVDGPSLTEYLTGGILTPQEVRDLRDRLARGLAAAHDKGVIHRDMSPDNIILGEGKLAQAKIIDFGIAKLADSSATTIIGDDFAGRYAYASPEQIGLYGGQVDARSDIYSLGLVLATAGTGKALNMGEISESLVSVIEARKRIPDFSSVPESLRNELGAMLQPDPADRPQSMREVIGLDGRLDSTGPKEGPAKKEQSPATPLSAEPAARPAAAAGGGRGWLWPTVTAGVAAAAVGGYFAWQNMAPPADPPQPVAQADTTEPQPPQPEAPAPEAGTQQSAATEAPVEAPAQAQADTPSPVAESASEEQAPEEPLPAAPADEPPTTIVAEEAESPAAPEPAPPGESAAVQTPAPAEPAVAAADPGSEAEEAAAADAVAPAEEAGEPVAEEAEEAEEVAAQAAEADEAVAATVNPSAEPAPVELQPAGSGESLPETAPEETAEPAAAPVEPDDTQQAGETQQVDVEPAPASETVPAAAPEGTEARVVDQAAGAPAEEPAEEPAADAQVAALPEPTEAELQAAALAAAEAALTRSEKLEIQRDLRALGHYSGGIDGSFGPGTRAGIERYQQVAGLEPTGYLDDAQRADLARAAQVPRAEEAARLAAERQAAEREAAEREAAEAAAARAAAERRAAEEAAARARALAQQQQAASEDQALAQQQAALPGESEMDRLRRVAEAGDPIAQASLGLRYYRGQGVGKDLDEAYRWTKLAAEQGEARAQSNLGFYYMNGEGVGRDPAQAARWWREAASQGLQQAQFNLGLLYETGRGVSADPQEAARWYRLASEQGDRQAKSRLDGLVSRGLVPAEE